MMRACMGYSQNNRKGEGLFLPDRIGEPKKLQEEQLVELQDVHNILNITLWHFSLLN